MCVREREKERERKRENKRNGIDSDHINSYNKKQQPNNPPEIDVINGLNLEVRTRWPKRPNEQTKDKNKELKWN